MFDLVSQEYFLTRDQVGIDILTVTRRPISSSNAWLFTCISKELFAILIFPRTMMVYYATCGNESSWWFFLTDFGMVSFCSSSWFHSRIDCSRTIHHWKDLLILGGNISILLTIFRSVSLLANNRATLKIVMSVTVVKAWTTWIGSIKSYFLTPWGTL